MSDFKSHTGVEHRKCNYDCGFAGEAGRDPNPFREPDEVYCMVLKKRLSWNNPCGYAPMQFKEVKKPEENPHRLI